MLTLVANSHSYTVDPDHPSRGSDAGTALGDLRYLLNRMMNHLPSFGEVSATTACAALLGFPAEVCSHNFWFCYILQAVAAAMRARHAAGFRDPVMQHFQLDADTTSSAHRSTQAVATDTGSAVQVNVAATHSDSSSSPLPLQLVHPELQVDASSCAPPAHPGRGRPGRVAQAIARQIAQLPPASTTIHTGTGHLNSESDNSASATGSGSGVSAHHDEVPLSLPLPSIDDFAAVLQRQQSLNRSESQSDGDAFTNDPMDVLSDILGISGVDATAAVADMFVLSDDRDHQITSATATTPRRQKRIVVVPQYVTYAYRGPQLAHLCWVEYFAVVATVPNSGSTATPAPPSNPADSVPESPDDFPLQESCDLLQLSRANDSESADVTDTPHRPSHGRVPNKTFEFADGHPLRYTHHQQLRSEIRVPILAGTPGWYFHFVLVLWTTMIHSRWYRLDFVFLVLSRGQVSTHRECLLRYQRPLRLLLPNSRNSDGNATRWRPTICAYWIHGTRTYMRHPVSWAGTPLFAGILLQTRTVSFSTLRFKTPSSTERAGTTVSIVQPRSTLRRPFEKRSSCGESAPQIHAPMSPQQDKQESMPQRNVPWVPMSSMPVLM